MSEVVAVCRDSKHAFAKPTCESITLVEGLGIEGDAHMGQTVQHLSRMAVDPTRPNLRQVHLIHAELHAELAANGFAFSSGQLGENITTRGVNLSALPAGTVLRLGADAQVELTGLRNPCVQLDRQQPGLMKALLDRDAEGRLIRKAGVMAIVRRSGQVRPGDVIAVELPPEPHIPLDRV